jgi:DNA-binding transcriptional ArsR family regulator
MPSFTHPRLEDVPLPVALHALADPCRLAIVQRLAEGGELSCSSATSPDVPKSTRSNHFKILRAAGLVRTRPAGRDHLNALRREEFEARFPGLLEAVMAHPEEMHGCTLGSG